MGAMGISGNRLAPCPDSPNCVCSDDRDRPSAVAPFIAPSQGEPAWAALIAILETDPAYTIVTRNEDYVHAEARTRWLRFTDDLEFHLRPERSEIAVRSASRIGYSDMGANRRRIEALRRAVLSTQP